MAVDILISLAGLLLILLVLNDFVGTTLRLEGAGSLSRILMAFVWSTAFFLRRRLGRPRSLARAGVVALLANIVMWTVLLWLGWLLLFLPHDEAVMPSHGEGPADFWSRVYFVGFSLITLGVGDYVPGSPLFQGATVLAAMSGFFLLTLSVTYLVPVMAAVVQSRQLAAQILLLGDSPEDLALRLVVPGAGTSYLDLLHGLTGPVVLLSQHHFAYPVLKYFPSSRRLTSTAVGFAVLDEALSMIQFGLGHEDAVSEGPLLSVRTALADYLKSQVSAAGEALPATPPAPSLEPLRKAGLSTVSDRSFAAKLGGLDERRRLLHSLLLREHRTWSDLRAGDSSDRDVAGR